MATPNEQLNAMRNLAPNWDGYGAASPAAHAIDLAIEFTALLSMLMGKSNGNPYLVHVSPTRVGGVLIEWDDPVAEHEIDVEPDGSVGFLHRNRTTGVSETRRFSAGPLQPGLLEQIRQLVAA